MSSKFVRDDDGTIRIVFTSQEAHVVINLTAQLLELLGEGSLNADIEADPLFQMMGLGASEQPPEDPVLRRYSLAHTKIKNPHPSFVAIPNMVCARRNAPTPI